jgi:hypothetical protein
MDFVGKVTLFGAETVPTGLSVNLRAFNAETGEPADLGFMMPVPVNADGSYIFEDIPHDFTRAYFTSITYQGYSFASEPVQAVGETRQLALDVIIYEVTTAQTHLAATAWVNQLTAYDGRLEVISVMQVQNLSETSIVSTGEFLPDGRPIALTIRVPDDATVLPPDSPTQLVSADGTTLIETQPLLPRGQKLVSVRYSVPYRQGEVLSLPTDMTVAGVVRVLVRPLEMRVDSAALPPLGEEFIGGEFYKAYGDQLALRAGLTLDVVLTGQPLAADNLPTPSPTTVSASTSPLTGLAPAAAITADLLTPILALLALVVGGMTLALMLRRPKR